MEKKPAKYLDQSRFPKVVTEGYEKEFKANYKLLSQGLVNSLTSKMVSFIK